LSRKKLFIAMVLVNLLLGVLFVVSNYVLWDVVNAQGYASPHWGPFTVSYSPRMYVDGVLSTATTIVFLSNYPFWLFWVAMIVNMWFGFLLLKNKETEASTT
jgi:hypothetical protein